MGYKDTRDAYMQGLEALRVKQDERESVRQLSFKEAIKQIATFNDEHRKAHEEYQKVKQKALEAELKKEKFDKAKHYLSTNGVDLDFRHRTVKSLRESKEEPISKHQKAIYNCIAQAINNKRDAIIIGSIGVGKTTILSAIVNSLCLMGENAKYVEESGYIKLVERKDYNRQDAIDNCKVLVLDDMAVKDLPSWQRDNIHDLINYRSNNRLITVYCTNEDIKVIKNHVGPRAFDRMFKRVHNKIKNDKGVYVVDEFIGKSLRRDK